MRSELVVEALGQAVGSRPRSRGRIFHSDRSSQYGSKAFRLAMGEASMVQSMSARANPYHSAWSESAIGTIKSEMLQGGRFIDRTDARTELFAYIDGYYNTARKHSSLDYLSPLQYEARIASQN